MRDLHEANNLEWEKEDWFSKLIMEIHSLLSQ